MSGFAYNFINPCVCFEIITLPTVNYKVSNCPSQSKIDDTSPIIEHTFVLDPQPIRFIYEYYLLKFLNSENCTI